MSRTNRSFAGEKRCSRCLFPIEQDVRYQFIKGTRVSQVGTGRTCEISSREVRFTTQQIMRPGERVRLAVDWPALINGTCPMKLVIRGRVLCSDSGAATVRIERHEFRTRGSPLAVFETCAMLE